MMKNKKNQQKKPSFNQKEFIASTQEFKACRINEVAKQPFEKIKNSLERS